MKTAEEMYQFARENKLGYNWLPIIQKKHFELIEKNLLDNEEALITFIGRHKFEDDDSAFVNPNNFRSQEEYNEYMRKTDSERAGRNTGKLKYFDCDGFFAYAITTEGRLMYAHWKPFNHDATSIPLGNINNVNPNTNLIWGSVRVETFKDNFSIFWTKNTVMRINKMIQKGISDSRDGVMDGVTSSMRSGRGTTNVGNNFGGMPTGYSNLASGRVNEEDIDGSTPMDGDLATDDLKRNLQKLNMLLKEGLITEAEYKKKKADILNRL